MIKLQYVSNVKQRMKRACEKYKQSQCKPKLVYWRLGLTLLFSLGCIPKKVELNPASSTVVLVSIETGDGDLFWDIHCLIDGVRRGEGGCYGCLVVGDISQSIGF